MAEVSVPTQRKKEPILVRLRDGWRLLSYAANRATSELLMRTANGSAI